MARRGSRRKARRRSPKTVKLLGLAEAAVQANIVTEELAGASITEFIAGSPGPTLMLDGGGISLLEIAKRPELLSTIGARAMNPERIINIAIKSAVSNLGFRFAKRALRRPINMMNRMVFKNLGLGVSL
jgi:hypothetical protein